MLHEHWIWSLDLHSVTSALCVQNHGSAMGCGFPRIYAPQLVYNLRSSQLHSRNAEQVSAARGGGKHRSKSPCPRLLFPAPGCPWLLSVSQVNGAVLEHEQFWLFWSILCVCAWKHHGQRSLGLGWSFPWASKLR